jgi:SAM-dependent methyltransferase
VKVSYRQFIKETLLLISDKIDAICRTTDPLIPPKHLYSRYGNGNLQAIGQMNFRFLLDKCNLGRDSKVLEIGTGIGRNALPLTAFLASEGSYDGFDIMKMGIDYCTAHITSRFSNFRFRWIDLQSSFYNDGGRGGSAREFTFPYPDASFDVVCSFSVYTHLQPDIVKRYLLESARVLKPGGRVLNTFFLLNEESLKGIEQQASEIKLRHQMDGYLVARKEVPEEAVGLPEQTVLNFHSECGFSRPTISYGSWCGRSRFDNPGHDIVVSELAL